MVVKHLENDMRVFNKFKLIVDMWSDWLLGREVSRHVDSCMGGGKVLGVKTKSIYTSFIF